MNTLTNKENMLEQVLNAIQDGVVVYDSTGQVVFVNEAHLAQTGLDREFYEGNSFYDFLKYDPPFLSKPVSLTVFETGEAASGIVEYHLSGKTVLVESAPFYLDSDEMFVMAIIRDMTEIISLQKKLEIEMLRRKSYQNRIKEIEATTNNPKLAGLKSDVMQSIYQSAARIAPANTPVLILGETGVGKDYLAKFIHENSGLTGRFIKVNCGAISANLLESELFGYEAGAFTNASNQGKKGLIETAKDGTLYLDEIGEMPVELQVKLLGVLQDKQFVRVGGTQMIDATFRLISATNANLEEKINNGTFRRDLFYRLNVISFAIPPLRQRPEDIIPLASALLEEFGAIYHKSVRLDQKASQWLLMHRWPGNIRELRNTLERIVLTSDSEWLQLEDESETLHPQPIGTASLKELLAGTEKAIIQDALERHRTLKETAENLGVDVSTLVRKCKKYRIVSRVKT